MGTIDDNNEHDEHSELPFKPIGPEPDLDKAFSIDPTPDSPDEEANEKYLQAELKKYQDAIQGEWFVGESYENGNLTPAEIREHTKKLLTQAVPKAVASLLYLSQHAANEQVKMKAATYIIDKAIGSEKGLVGNPLDDLLSEIHAAKD